MTPIHQDYIPKLLSKLWKKCKQKENPATPGIITLDDLWDVIQELQTEE